MSVHGKGLDDTDLDRLSYEALVDQIQAGNAKAEMQMVNRFAHGLRVMLSRKCSPDVAEDVSQETWRVVIEKVRNGDLRQPDRLPAFIHQIARNQVVMYFRKHSDTQEQPDDNDLVSPGLNPEQTYEINQLQQYVRDLIEQLDTPRDREILMRFYVQEEEKEEICKDLDLSSQHFNRVIYRAKMRMRSYLVKNLD
ncbi:sigma-70 family RNA polymerase sigma factor [Halioxenophilus sp. WMMB6]|uniref:RNA polymerase sigma factor n=1 Tax=Halioxenophilus sp. WMMB6 TaxID=3073815 RepID=UPI00295E2E1C|nr:sigma-70 family RNA polymerase sigma factor [Halioxenophilus sp. WMMB6]